jgi:Domain of unknown function (DUF4160)
MSPTVFRDGASRFFFFSREESRLHIHVIGPEGEAKFWLEPEVACAMNTGLSEKEILRFQRIILARKEEIINAWNRDFSG